MSIDFKRLVGVDSLAHLSGCETPFVERVLDKPAGFFRRHEIKKRRGGTRLIFEPVERLRIAHRELLFRLDDAARSASIGYPTIWCHGFVRKRSIITNARIHAGSKMLVRADIAAYFSSITLDRVKRFLCEKLRMNEDFARILLRFSSPKAHLIEGSPLSPLLANLVTIDLDMALNELAQKHNCNYSRYADDLTFSTGAGGLPTKLELRSILIAHDFKLADHKFRVSKRGQVHYVTGLSVTDSVPHAPRALKRRLRQEVYYSAKHGIEDHLSRREYASYQAGINAIDGLMKYVGGIEHGPQIGRLRAQWMVALDRSHLRPSFEYSPSARRTKVFGLVDETELKDGRTIIGLAITTEIDQLRSRTMALLDRLFADPFRHEQLAILDKEGLHYSRNHPSTKDQYIKIIASQDLRFYFALGPALPGETKSEHYLRLLRLVLMDRAKKFANQEFVVFCEQRGDIRRTDIAKIHSELVNENRKQNHSAASFITLEQKPKDESSLSSIDYALGVLRAVLSGVQSDSVERRHFEQLKPKFRMILDAASRQYYTRKNPLTPQFEPSQRDKASDH